MMLAIVHERAAQVLQKAAARDTGDLDADDASGSSPSGIPQGPYQAQRPAPTHVLIHFRITNVNYYFLS